MSNTKSMSTFRSYQTAFKGAFEAEKTLNNRLNWLKRNLNKIIENQNSLDLPKEKRIESAAIKRVLEFMFVDEYRIKWFKSILSELFDDHVMCRRENTDENGDITSVTGYLETGNISAYYLFMYLGYKAAKLTIETFGNGTAKKDLTEAKIYNVLRVDRKPTKEAKKQANVNGTVTIAKLRKMDLGVPELAELKKNVTGSEKSSITLRIKEIKKEASEPKASEKEAKPEEAEV